MVESTWRSDLVKSTTRIRTTGIGEAQIFENLEHWLSSEVEVSFLPNLDGVDIDVCGRGKIFEETVDRIKKAMKCFIYEESRDPNKARSLSEIIADLLVAQKMRLSVAESCSGGLLASLLTDIPGSSRYFEAGIVAYSNEAKSHFLGVSGVTIERFGAVSAQCAREMAAGVRRVTGSNIGLATTGIAGPTGGTPLKPVGLVYIACADAEKCLVENFTFPQGRTIHKERTARRALAMLWKQLVV